MTDDAEANRKPGPPTTGKVTAALACDASPTSADDNEDWVPFGNGDSALPAGDATDPDADVDYWDTFGEAVTARPSGDAFDPDDGLPPSLSGNVNAAPREHCLLAGKQTINELLLTPDGRPASDEVFICDVDSVLGFAGGDVIKRSVLDELISLRGAAYCNFWRSWFLRKVAQQSEAGHPVTKPAALFVQAVREGWKVDPRWPEFDESKHRVTSDTDTSTAAMADDDAFLDSIFGTPKAESLALLY